MVNLFEVWTEINAYLNKNMKEINKNYKFIKGNSIHNLPSYPYCITNVLVGYIQDNDTFEGTIIETSTKNGVKITRFTEPQMTFSLTFYSDKQEEAMIFATNTMSFLQTQKQLISYKCDIILLDCTKLVDKTSILETGYVYKWGFDIRLRVGDIVETQVDTIEEIELQ
ncbi:phage neck terminator protein [Clostridium haemolyticum]|uniref:Phage neck terminator protein gp12-like domain-containing protein n=1 Tax=Clostridium haemolyticum NCTC 9693 TaxID=1443114 RepID=A0ABR4TGW2_CLOHA|nr:hypothetical protein [Clostridium haemolyticum]KEI18252.1 hypothetical protein Z960_03800 [Clostridium haemolyticum NCTC 9693]KGN04175.1 hypothetical protein Z961_04290 [Clostridium haemolyticum NCTC 8350]